MSHTIYFSSGCPVTIYVQSAPRKIEPFQVQHNVLDMTHSNLQYIGAKSPQTTFQFMVYGHETMDYIEACVTSGSAFYYYDDSNNLEYFYVATDLSIDRQQALNYTDYWYKCTMPAVYLTSGSYYSGAFPASPPPPR
jgi:hypothetical protein